MYVYICALTMLPFFPTLPLLGTIPFRWGGIPIARGIPHVRGIPIARGIPVARGFPIARLAKIVPFCQRAWAMPTFWSWFCSWFCWTCVSTLCCGPSHPLSRLLPQGGTLWCRSMSSGCTPSAGTPSISWACLPASFGTGKWAFSSQLTKRIWALLQVPLPLHTAWWTPNLWPFLLFPKHLPILLLGSNLSYLLGQAAGASLCLSQGLSAHFHCLWHPFLCLCLLLRGILHSSVGGWCLLRTLPGKRFHHPLWGHIPTQLWWTFFCTHSPWLCSHLNLGIQSIPLLKGHASIWPFLSSGDTPIHIQWTGHRFVFHSATSPFWCTWCFGPCCGWHCGKSSWIFSNTRVPLPALSPFFLRSHALPFPRDSSSGMFGVDPKPVTPHQVSGNPWRGSLPLLHPYFLHWLHPLFLSSSSAPALPDYLFSKVHWLLWQAYFSR